MPIGQRLTNGAVVPLRKVREATVDALETLAQHAGVINGQGARLDALTRRVETLEAAQRRADGMETA